MGNLCSVIAHAASTGERDGAKRVLLHVPAPLWERLEKILADAGYEEVDFQAWVKSTFGVDLTSQFAHPIRRALFPCLSVGLWNAPLLGWVGFGA